MNTWNSLSSRFSFKVTQLGPWLPACYTADDQQATLIIRHPDDGKLYVNFDQEILQLIREAKILDQMGIEIPESAKIALFQVRSGKLLGPLLLIYLSALMSQCLGLDGCSSPGFIYHAFGASS